MSVVAKSLLRQYREELNPRVTQDTMARLVKISLQW